MLHSSSGCISTSQLFTSQLERTFTWTLVRMNAAYFCDFQLNGLSCANPSAVRGMHVNTPLVDNICCAQELTNDRLVSEADLARLLGTLRYLQSLKVARQKVEVGAANNAEAAGAAADHSSASISHSGSSQSPQIAFIAKRFHKFCYHSGFCV